MPQVDPNSVFANRSTPQFKALYWLLAVTTMVCLVSAIQAIAVGWAPRVWATLFTGLALLSLIVLLRLGQSIDMIMMASALLGIGSLTINYLMSGGFFYIGIGTLTPAVAAMFLNFRQSLLILTVYVLITLCVCISVSLGWWVPPYTIAQYAGGHLSHGMITVLVTIAVAGAVIWNEKLADRFATIVQGNCDGIVDADEHGVITAVQGAIFKQLGYQEEQLVGRHHFDFLTESSRQTISESIQTEPDGRRTFGGEVKLQTPSGVEHWARLKSSTTQGYNGRVRWITAIQDINEEVTSRERLNEISRLEGLGEVCGGLAHDFNNLLTVIGVYSEMVEDQDLRRELQAAQAQASELTSSLLAFSRQQQQDDCVADLVSSLNSIRLVVDSLVPANIEVVWDVRPEQLNIKLDPANLQQIVINLLTNAIHAMPSGGVLNIRAGLLDSDNPLSLPCQKTAWLEFRDNGIGMTQEIQRRAMDPFFTTKPRGEGTGIGLSTVHSVVTRCGGHVSIRSRPGRGTVVNLMLPVIDVVEPQANKASCQGTVETTVAGVGTSVLLVEDRGALRTAMQRFLESRECEVESFEFAEDALAALQTGNPVDLIVSDVMLPGMSGIDLARQIRRTDPETAILLISGYELDPSFMTDLADDRTRFLQKPFQMRTLLDLIQQMRPIFNQVELTKTD